MKKSSALLYIIPILIIILSCSKKSGPFQGEVTFITGTLRINSVDAPVGSSVKKDDILLTGSNSQATIQISETAVITMQSDTEMKFDDLVNNQGGSPKVSMELNKGTSFHKVLKKGTDYTVKAPTAVASVRGTSFEVSGDSTKTRISVETGTVYVKKKPGLAGKDKNLTDGQNQGLEEIILTAGQSLEVTSGSAVNRGKPDGPDRAIEKKEKPLSVKKAANKAPVTVKKPEKETIPDPAVVKALMDKKNPAIKDIKEVYSRIDRISLYSGEIITGAIIERGNIYSVMTTGGIVKVASKDIQSDQVIR